MTELRGVLETVVYAVDLDAAERFYAEVLGLQPISRTPGRSVFFRSGPGVFLVFNPESTATTVVHTNGVPIPIHGARGAGHAAFRVHEDELPAWRRRLEERNVPIEAEIAWPQGGRSIYVRDPDLNLIEISEPAKLETSE